MSKTTSTDSQLVREALYGAQIGTESAYFQLMLHNPEVTRSLSDSQFYTKVAENLLAFAHKIDCMNEK